MILDTIVERKKEEVANLQKYGIQIPEKFREREIGEVRGFRNALIQYKGLSIIAEAKKASPSKGVISQNFQVDEIVASYERNGAQAISVLTDVDFFQGSLEYLMLARETITLPVIRKDFIIDELQITESSACGADAILLIAAILDEVQLKEYFEMARELGMDVLMEVHNEQELEKSLCSGCNLIGVNNRNLNDFSVDIETTFRLQKYIPETMPLVSESGLRDNRDIERLIENNVTAALIGETLMRGGTEGKVLRDLRKTT